MLSFLFLAVGLFANQAFALVMSPMVDAASQAGYVVFGEIEFQPRKTSFNPQSFTLNSDASSAAGTCLESGPKSHELHFVLFSWADQEFKHAHRRGKELANQRAMRVEAYLRKSIPASVSVEKVNMASMAPKSVSLGAGFQEGARSGDIKKLLYNEGAAPTSRLEMGLFGEFGQHSKTVVWMHCRDIKPHQNLARQQMRILAKN